MAQKPKIQIDTVPVDPIAKSKRGWFNIFIGAVGAMVSAPQVQNLVSGYPRVAGALVVLGAAINYALLWKSKQGVVSKNVEVK